MHVVEMTSSVFFLIWSGSPLMAQCYAESEVVMKVIFNCYFKSSETWENSLVGNRD